MKHLTYTIAFFTLILFSACSDGAINPVGKEGPTVNSPETLGLVEVTITGIGTPEMSASAQPAARNVAADLTRPNDPAGKDGTIQLEAVSHGSFTYGPRGSGGVRYLYATFKVRNAQTDGTPYTTPRTNLTFLAVDTDGTGTAPATYGQTPLSELRLYNGDELSATEAEAFANAMVPTGLAKLAADGSIGVQYADVLQVFTEDEIAGLTNLPTGVSLFPYGFVTRNPDNPESRTLPANPASGQYDGFVTFAFKIPLQAQANQDPFEITALFLPFDDSQTRLTQSLEGQTPDGNQQTAARAGALTADYVTIFPGSGYQGAFRLLCGPVRVTGPAGSPSTVLFPPAPTFSSLSPDPYATDGSAGNIPKTQAFNATFSGPVTGATTNTFIVRGSQSGVQFTGDAYSGNGTNTISSPSGSFFPGEQVTVSLTPGLGICPGGTYHYRVETPSGTGGFSAATSFPVGNSPQAVTIGDLNGDGSLDMVTANFNSDNVSVWLGDGSGGFTGEATILMGDGSNSVALGDLDGDGSLDMVSANYSSDNVSVRLGDGAGGFAGEVTFSVGDGPQSVALGDLNGDGSLDVVTANSVSGNVSVRLGDGFGGFGSEATFSVGNVPLAVALGDLNSDGSLDMVSANYSSDNVSVRLGDGAGGFGSETTFTMGNGPTGIALGDLNGDGSLDMVTANGGSNNVSVRLGGAGGFASEATFSVGNDPHSVVLGDLNGDGSLDMVTANRGDNNVGVRLGDGAGGFADEVTFPVGITPLLVALGDLDGNGSLDMVTANALSDNVSVRLNQ